MRPEDQLKSQPIEAVGAGMTETIRDQDKIQLVLAYLGIFALIPLLTVKDSPYVQWHAKNGLVLALAGGVGIPVLVGLLGWIPVIGAVFACLAPVAFLVVDILAMVKALGGVRWRIPGISDLAEKL